MCSEARPTNNHSRPKIELVRVSSSERAKIPVNPVQLNLTYCHLRSATYTGHGKSMAPIDVGPPTVPTHHHHHHTRRPRWLWAPWRPHTHSGPPLSTKSCDDLHRVSVRVDPTAASRSESCLLTLLLTPSLLLTPRTNTPPHTAPKYRLWRGFSRSARDVSVAPPSGPPRPAVSLAVMDKLTQRAAHPVRHKASTLPYSQASGPQPMGRRHRGLMALLRRFSPRLKRTPSPDRPWYKVEPRPADRTSVASDHSFETALHVRHPDLAVYEGSRVINNSHTPGDIPIKSEGSRGSRGGLSGILTSLRPSKAAKEEKNTVKNAVHEKSGEKNSSTNKPQPEQRVPAIHTKDPTTEEGQQHNGRTLTHRPSTQAPPHIPATMVPALYLHPTQVDSRPTADVTTSSVPLHTSTRPTATAQRPHTLNLPNRGQSRAGWTAAAEPPPPHPPPPPLLPPSMSQPLQNQTTSVDSIGSCSLDVNATGTTSPATMEAVDGSRRSLRSVSLENNLSTATSAGVSTSNTPLRPILKPQPYTDPGSVRENGISDSNYKTPSYLGISCAVNGYTRLNRYDSALRDGFRSRDASPARLAFSRSRDSSPMRPKVFDPRAKTSPQATAAKIRELKEELARFKAEFPHPPERGRQNSTKKLGRRPSQGRSISVDRGYLKKSESGETMNGHQENGPTTGAQRVRLVEINMTDSSTVKSSNYQYSFEQSVMRGGMCETSDSFHSSALTNGDPHDAKSFIQSRIERLYGPGALGVGFRSRRSLLELEKEQRDRESGSNKYPQSDSHYEPEAKAPEGFPSVFRHLRPEFRTQLQVKRNNRLRQEGMSLEVPVIEARNVNSPKRPERIIPITLTDTIENKENKPQAPPVPLPKPLIPHSNRGEKNVSGKDNRKIVVQKIVNGNGNITEKEIEVDESNGINGSAVPEEIDVSACKDVSVVGRTNKVNGVTETVRVNGNLSASKGEKDGHYHLKIVEGVVADIEAQVASIEPALESHGSQMTEEVRGKVLAAIGKARLLVSQKIQQFQGLCHKNIAGSADEEFPTTCEDLAGFWDMVSIQVDDIRTSLQEIKTLQSNGWKEVPETDTVDDVHVTTGRARRRPAPKPLRPSKTTKASAEKSEEDKARDEARKKLMEERRKAMKEAMRAKRAEAEAKKTEGGDAVEIFVPEDK